MLQNDHYLKTAIKTEPGALPDLIRTESQASKIILIVSVL